MEYFKKVYIKSKDDLPKEKGGYDTELGYIYFNPNNLKIEGKGNRIDNVEWWVDNINWYLLPVSLPEVTDEEIDEMRFATLGVIGHEDIDNAYIDGFKKGAKWMRNKMQGL